MLKKLRGHVTLNAAELLARDVQSQVYSWSERDFLLYALCVGLGDDPGDLDKLPFVVEYGRKVLPTFPTVIAWIAQPTFTLLGVDPVFALHGEQKIEIYRPIAGPVSVRVDGRVVGVHDKGLGRGALFVTQHAITDLSDGATIAVLTTTCFGRKEGGSGDAGAAMEPPHSLPTRVPDRVLEVKTPANLALLYRLTGDANPLHFDPATALAAGFQRPILHGLCGFGMTCRAVLEAYAAFDPARIASHEARFSAPIYPGESLAIELWRDAQVVSFRVRVIGRDVVAISNGRSILRPPGKSAIK
jgi:acyl dehydratase